MVKRLKKYYMVCQRGVFQHENEHMNGYVFTDLVSKFKLDRAEKARMKMIKEFAKGGAIR